MANAAIKIPPQGDDKIVDTKSIDTRRILLALVLGLFGALLNSFPIELAFNVTLVIGNLAFIVAAAYLRPALTLCCAVICVSPLLFIWGHPFGFITFGCEALFISYMRGKGWYLPTADFLYWLIIGMPLTALLIWLNSADSQEYLLFSLFKQSINAVFYTALGVIVFFVFNENLSRWVKSQQPKLVKNLKQYMHYILWIMSAFFVIGVCLFLSRNLNAIQQQQVEDKLDISSQYLARIIESYVDEHKKAVGQIANKLSAIEPTYYNDALVKMHTLYPGFLTMLIANSEADIVASSPLSLMDNISTGHLNVADRDYFSEAFFNQLTYMSPVFLGRGFGDDAIIAISAPIYRHDNQQPSGIVEGSLNLNLFDKINRAEATQGKIDIVLTDGNDNVIYAESSLALSKLSKFDYRFDQRGISHDFLLIENDTSQNIRYLYRQITLSNGWKVFALIEHRQILKLIEQQYSTIFMSLFFIFALVILIANQFANSLNKPLAFALKELALSDGKEGYKAIPHDAPTEFLALYDELQQSKAKLLKQQSVLEEQVSHRTDELNKANQALKALASKDSLTGLYNRRYLESSFSELQAVLSRNNASMMVAMLDLDHFKKLNDEYGHLIGDNCLVYISDVIKGKFDRRSDIVARFGGEEFIIVAQSDEQSSILNKLEELRKTIAKHSLPLNPQNSVGVTISIGTITAKAAFSDNIDDWIQLADEQLYQAKKRGRNQLSNKSLPDLSDQ